MASAPSEPRKVMGRLDRDGRLIAADAELEALQVDAGSELGKPLALPQIAAVARLARKLGIPVSRPAVAASPDYDLDLMVRARPEGEEVALIIEGWNRRPPTSPRLTALLGRGAVKESVNPTNEWQADEELKLISMSGGLAEHLGIDLEEAAGKPLTRVVKLEEDDHGEMPLIAALATRRAFTGQPARSRNDNLRGMVLNGDVVTGPDGGFAGFRGTVEIDSPAGAAPTGDDAEGFDDAIDKALRSPLDRIIESAEKIVERADGPLRSDYAAYGSDIAAAARHLLSVIRAMNESPAAAQNIVDLAALAAEAVVLVETSAEQRQIVLKLMSDGPLPASGEERAVIQILVNLIGNAVRYSPAGGTVELRFDRGDNAASVTVSDEGQGIAAADQQRIFERFERANAGPDGTGLGLAISRRLARSMGGDVTLDSEAGSGARFTLSLPRA